MQCVKKRVIPVMLIVLTLFLCTSCDSTKQLEYYSDIEQYIWVTGTITHIKYSEDGNSLYIAFDDMSVNLSDNCFKVVGENVRIVRESAYKDKLQIGERAEFQTAPKYFGDGYTMPIVSIRIGDTTLLAFEEGITNFLYWLNTK